MNLSKNNEQYLFILMLPLAISKFEPMKLFFKSVEKNASTSPEFVQCGAKF